MNTWYSIIPPVFAIILAIATRKVILSLFFGILAGAIILTDFSLFSGLAKGIETIVTVFESNGNTRTILFSVLIGAVITLVQQSGGVRAFVDYFANSKLVNSKRKTGFFAAITGMCLFIESNISIITVGTVAKPLFRKFHISKEKLAYIADSTCAPIAVLIPFNAWGAYLIAQISNFGIENSVDVFTQSIPYFFYPIIALLLTFVTIYFSLDLGEMKQAEAAVEYTEKDERADTPLASGKPSYFVYPMLALILGMFLFMYATGNGDLRTGSGSKSVLYAVILSLAVAYFLYKKDRIFSHSQFMKLSFQGMHHLLEVVVILILSFGINTICKELETGKFLASILSENTPQAIIPAMIFVLSAFIAFSTGTSWGTFAIMMSIGLPLAITLALPIPLVVGAIVSGGIWGDHCSPISDTTVISALAADCSHIAHVKTQLPYAILGGSVSLILFLVMGFL